MKRKFNLRIQDIKDSVAHILKSTELITEDEFYENIVLQMAVIRWFEIIGEAAKYVPLETKKQYPKIPWKEMAAMRDVAIHDYADLIPEDIWKTIKQDLPVLKKELAQIILL